MPGPDSPDPLIVLGEVHTAPVPNSTALNRAAAEELLALVPGYAVRWRARPGTIATSPTIAVGFDCKLAVSSGAAMRAIGTAGARGVLAGGRILQASAQTRVIRAAVPRREVWSHYLSRVGVGEVITKVTPKSAAELGAGFLAWREAPAGALDLSSMVRRLLRRIAMDPALDRRAPFRAATTRLRWAARIGGVRQPELFFRLDEGLVRTVLITVGDEAQLAAAGAFCEELARHDWLLTLAATVTEDAEALPVGPESADVIAAVLAHLTHLWLPGAHTPAVLRPLWQQLDDDPGFSMEWFARTRHLRNRMDVGMLTAGSDRSIGRE